MAIISNGSAPHTQDVERNTTCAGEASTGRDLSAVTLPILQKRKRWTLGILEDPETSEVPGSVLLLPKASPHNVPLGVQNIPPRRLSLSFPPTHLEAPRIEAISRVRSPSIVQRKKRTRNGKIILEPQPEDTMNDPLNWPILRRDAALVSLGFYCLVGGGMTTILAAGFTNVAATYDVTIPQVALTTGLYMTGLGVGSVIASPTAIAFGKRPVYLVASLCFLLTSVWCALSPTYTSLVVARVIQGIAVSPVECLPSSTIAEIYHLHERAYRLGVYTLLLLGGKNLVPLASAAVIESLGWRFVFWIVTMVVGFCFVLLFLFVPETFWDRSPVPHKSRRWSHPSRRPSQNHIGDREKHDTNHDGLSNGDVPPVPGDFVRRQEHHAQLITAITTPDNDCENLTYKSVLPGIDATIAHEASSVDAPAKSQDQLASSHATVSNPAVEPDDCFNSYMSTADTNLMRAISPEDILSLQQIVSPQHYTKFYRSAPPKTYAQTLKPYNGRLSHDNWFRVAARPFILLSYPSILWSSAVYALSVGWLIILSESVAEIYRNRETYNFDAIQTGLVYVSPFIGGILGTVVAGKVSDIIVRFMARKNDGVYEPEFRLVMAIPVLVCTTVGLMGYGWSAQERDAWIVPTVFFGITSFGCTLGSTTAITFAVDSYRQYSGEALVSLNWCKNIFDGLVFSLFFNDWLKNDGPKIVFLALGGIQIFFLLMTIPMYIFGKRCRMWTVRKNFMEKF